MPHDIADSRRPDALASAVENEGSAEGRILRLARRELGRTWPSYLSAVLGNLLLGFFSLTALGLALSTGEGEASFAADVLLLTIAANLATNWTSRNYIYLVRDDPFSAHLAFLRSLPISAGEIVAARTAVMLACTVFMAVVFFLPSYLILDGLWRETGIGPARYLGFAAIWAGYAFFCAGVILYLEFGMCGRSALWVFMGWLGLLIGVLVLCYVVFDVRLAAGSLGLAGSYGALPGLISLAAGGAGLALLARITARRVRGRSL